MPAFGKYLFFADYPAIKGFVHSAMFARRLLQINSV